MKNDLNEPHLITGSIQAETSQNVINAYVYIYVYMYVGGMLLILTSLVHLFNQLAFTLLLRVYYM